MIKLSIQYNVYRSTDNSNFDLLGSAVTTNYIDSTVVSGNDYYYVVTTVNSEGESVYSNHLFVSIPTKETDTSQTETTQTDSSETTPSDPGQGTEPKNGDDSEAPISFVSVMIALFLIM